jgi:hypothetical protein
MASLTLVVWGGGMTGVAEVDSERGNERLSFDDIKGEALEGGVDVSGSNIDS